MSISEDPLYPWALHRLVLNHERVGNYQTALNCAYESQDQRLFENDTEAHKVFNETIERLENLVVKYGPVNESLRPEEKDEMQELFDNAFQNLKQIAEGFSQL